MRAIKCLLLLCLIAAHHFVGAQTSVPTTVVNYNGPASGLTVTIRGYCSCSVTQAASTVVTCTPMIQSACPSTPAAPPVVDAPCANAKVMPWGLLNCYFASGALVAAIAAGNNTLDEGINLDGIGIHSGFGPFINYATQPDGSVAATK